MGMRATLNQKPLITISALVLTIAMAVYLSMASMKPEKVRVPTQAYFTVDDGQTLFLEDRHRIPPFLHEGKEAVGAAVFTCDGGRTRFVGYLEKFTPAYKAACEAAQAQSREGKAPADPSSGGGRSARSVAMAGPPPGGPAPLSMLIKKPGGTDWVPMVGPEGLKILAGNTGANGSARRPERVEP